MQSCLIRPAFKICIKNKVHGTDISSHCPTTFSTHFKWSLLPGNRLDSLQKLFYKLLLRTGIPGSSFSNIFSFTKTAQRSRKPD